VTASPRVHLAKIEPGYREQIQAGLAYVGFFDNVPSRSTIFLKPNFTYPQYRPGVMTSYECLEAVVEVLVAAGYRVIIGEADSGGYNRFSMDEVFKGMKIDELCQRTGARFVNISFEDAEILRVKTRFRTVEVPVPKLLLHEIDAFISMPVPKIHMNTLVSMSIKNQWGCIQEPAMRLRLHPIFSEVIYELNRQLPKPHSIIDGRFGLNRSGPMRGDVVDLNWVLISNDLVAADRTCCRLMQIDESRVKYLRYFRSKGWWCNFDEIDVNAEIGPFQTEKFYLKLHWTDLPGIACFNNSFLAWLGYRSFLAGFAHWLLYLFREPFYEYHAERAKVRKQ
jgi:uncharacterized protein (DUF362 family)